MSRLICRICAMIVIVTLLLAPNLFTGVVIAQDDTVQGNEVEVWARWKLELDFTNGAIEANWTVAVGETDTSGSLPVIKPGPQETATITCIPHGSFQLDKQEAIFDGNGYLECKIPSFYHKALALAAQAELQDELAKKFYEHCSCVNPVPWITGDLTVDPSGSPNPVLYEANGALVFYTPLLPDMAQAVSDLRLNGQSLQQANGTPLIWPVKREGNLIWSGIGVDFFEQLKDPSWATFLDNTTFATAAKDTLPGDFLDWEGNSNPVNFAVPTGTEFTITNKETTLLIGYDGTQHFVGKIRKLGVDPGCTAE